MTSRSLVGAAIIAGAALSIPATASAATIAPSAACYLRASDGVLPVSAAVGGLAPGQSVSLRLSRKGTVAGTSAPAAADAAGNVTLGIPTWSLDLGGKPTKEVGAVLEVIDTATGAVVEGGATEVKLANFAQTVTGSRNPRTWKVQGLAVLAGSATYYAHYFNNGKYKGRLKLGTGKGACGYLTAKRPLTPFSKIGRYDVVVQASKTFDEKAPGFKGRVVVTRRVVRR